MLLAVRAREHVGDPGHQACVILRDRSVVRDPGLDEGGARRGRGRVRLVGALDECLGVVDDEIPVVRVHLVRVGGRRETCRIWVGVIRRPGGPGIRAVDLQLRARAGARLLVEEGGVTPERDRREGERRVGQVAVVDAAAGEGEVVESSRRLLREHVVVVHRAVVRPARDLVGLVVADEDPRPGERSQVRWRRLGRNCAEAAGGVDGGQREVAAGMEKEPFWLTGTSLARILQVSP